MSFNKKLQSSYIIETKPAGCLGLKPNTLKKLKSITGHIGLLATLVIYTFIGGIIFRQIELPSEQIKLDGLKADLLQKRQELLNNINATSSEWEVEYLQPYEKAVESATRAGLSMEPFKLGEEPCFADRWSILQAVFFASTILTTIGYGNVFPSTFLGRIFCILFALIGIPLTLTVIADYGKLFAKGVSALAKKSRTKMPSCLNSCMPANQAGKNTLGALGAVLLLFIYLACGAGIFKLWENEWSLFEAFYFCFVTMTTIGFGDVVPTKPNYMLFCTGYILIGLALTSTIIELVRMQYADSWKKLQSLSGPLADTLRKLGEQAGGDMSALQHDLKRVFQVISMPRRRKSGVENREIKDSEWEAAVEAILRDIANSKAKPEPRKSIVQIIIYESSV
ncbi:TWiK family of potassium channels protein 7-like isoform X2 [Phymastichus coffea]|uniref:TWiK family of potassium channels protein 7-like isoform X2 n=1 Tax=Phymastichus coffea TaxID=108790 RepID=UPI00273C37D0|nr:TWiK family of potassium channels protein 7-like isoform X2 [Phymastichus coffea]